MDIRYDKWYSTALGREMEIKSYGHAGKCVLYIPCQDGRFYDFENFGMLDAWRPFIEAGQAMVFAVDTIDTETWSYKNGNPYWRIRRHEDWVRYLCEEVVPYMHAKCDNRGAQSDGVMVFGASLGATHAANLYFRFPDLFDTVLALSGLYDAAYGFDGYMDEKVYLNSPINYIPNMAPDHPYLEKYRRNRAVFCVGQGPWEIPESTRALERALRDKGIPAMVDYWGHDVQHDWCWWFKQVEYFVPQLLEKKEEST
ncbi:MAG: esterase family protein [Oscillospiraceae bacterium]|nr:esterase family protein [Oscillospiraceae bacterium]